AVAPFPPGARLTVPTAAVPDVVVHPPPTGLISRIGIHTPQIDGQRYVQYAGDTEISGVNGTAAPVNIRFLNTAGSIASALLPTGNVTDVVTADGTDYTVTLIDNGQPLVIIDANDLGATGYETVPELTDNTDLKTRIEALRLAAAQVMGLGDVADESYPKMTLVAAPRAGGAMSTRSFIPHRVDESIGVLAAVTVATAVLLQGSVAAQLGTPGTGKQQSLGIEHPSGVFE